MQVGDAGIQHQRHDRRQRKEWGPKGAVDAPAQEGERRRRYYQLHFLRRVRRAEEGLDRSEEERVACGPVFAEPQVAAAVRRQGHRIGPVERDVADRQQREQPREGGDQTPTSHVHHV